MFFHGQGFDAGGAKMLPILGAIGDLRDPTVQPILEIFQAAGLFVILREKSVIAAVVALDGRRMRAAGFVDDGCDEEAGYQRAIRIRGNHTGLDNFFCYYNYFAGGACAVHCYSQAAPEVRVALCVAALHVQDGDIRTQSARTATNFSSLTGEENSRRLPFFFSRSLPSVA